MNAAARQLGKALGRAPRNETRAQKHARIDAQKAAWLARRRAAGTQAWRAANKDELR